METRLFPLDNSCNSERAMKSPALSQQNSKYSWRDNESLFCHEVTVRTFVFTSNSCHSKSAEESRFLSKQ